MYRAKRLYLLLGVLVVVCAAAFLALRMEARQEQIQNSGETVLEIDPDSVQTLSWVREGETLSFHREDGTWTYDEDAAFPVDQERIASLLSLFDQFGVTFVIEDVEDYGMYGLDDPVCTIRLTLDDDQSYTITLGDFSTMDSQRYVSIGDGNAYLVPTDPLDSFSVQLRDLIDQDDVPYLAKTEEIRFSGAENYTVTYEEDSADAYCDEDLFFTQLDGENLPLDTYRVEDYLSAITNLALTNYVTYNADEDD